MTDQQATFIKNMTRAQALVVLAKFNNDPEVADRKSAAAFAAFRIAYETVNPGEYIQRRNMAHGVSYHFVSAE